MQTICEALQYLKDKQKLTTREWKACEAFFQKRNQGDLIYPGVLVSHLEVDLIAAYKVLEMLKEQGIVRTVYEVHCFDTSMSIGTILDSLEQFQSGLQCPYCKKPLTIEDHLRVLYKVA